MGRYVNPIAQEKKNNLRDFLTALFENNYRSTLTDESSKKFEAEVFDKAKSLGFDIDGLTFDGEFLDDNNEVPVGDNSFWVTYMGETIFTHKWKKQ